MRSVGALCAVVAVFAAGGGTAAAAVTVSGTVFADVDGDGLLSAGDETLAGVRVGFETALFATTDAEGRYQLSAPTDGQVWVRIPDGFEPAPVWQDVRLAAGDRTVDLPLRRSRVTGAARFVAAADSHIGNGVPLDDLRVSFREATSVAPAPHFFVIVGDVTQGNAPAEFRDLKILLGETDVPFVPVVGNHDIYDGGTAWRAQLGPPQYSFDAGGVHFIVLDFSVIGANLAAEVDFVRRDVALSPPGTPVVAFTHAPLDDGSSAALADAGVDYLFTGHWHSNRFIQHGPMLEVTTQMLVSGGLDLSPAGYRVAAWNGERFDFTHHTIVDQPVLRVIHPRPGSCVPAGEVEVVVAAESGTPVGEVTLSVDGAAAVSMAPRGGWTHTAKVTVAAGEHTLSVGAGFASAPRESTLCVEAPAATTLAVADWPQLQGGPQHHGATATALAPPLTTLWARTVGGHLLGGSAVVADGRLFVPVVDLGDNSAGGVVALDARTGATLWEHRTGHAVRNAPAVWQGLVIFGSADGRVTAADVATGAVAWTADLADNMSKHLGWLYAAPTVADGVVYIGVQRRFAALDAATGRELWSVDPSPSGYWLSSYSSAGVSGGVVVAAFARGYDGVVAWDALDGRELWRVPGPLATAVNSAIAVEDTTVYFTNAETQVHAVDLTSPIGPRWSLWTKKLVSSASNWTYGIMTSSALAGDTLVVPTLFGSLVAIDRRSGAELWRHGVDPTTIRPVHYLGAETEAWMAAPVVTGDIVWAGGADGVLYALALDGGRKLWSVDLGAPITAAPVPAGDLLFVGTYDGTIQALRHDPGPLCEPGKCPGAEDDGGCAVGGRGSSALGWLTLAALALAARWRLARRP